MDETFRQESGRRRAFDFSGIPRQKQTLALACILFWSVLVYLGLTRFVVLAVEVSGESMVPTLADGERRFVQRWEYSVRAPQRGELVAIRQNDYEYLSVKRIIALPYERVQIRAGGVYVNGERIEEPYLPEQTKTWGGALGNRAFRVEGDCYFVLGDNRSRSFDSRDFGAIPREDLLGPIRP